MTSFAGALREARYDTIPKLPELLPELAADRHIILMTLQNTYADRGRYPDEVPKPDWNKAERYTIAGHFIIKQADMAVEGTGPEARFKDFRAVPSSEGSQVAFGESVTATQAIAARRVKADYRGTEGWLRNSYTLGAERYRRLGMAAVYRDGLLRRKEGTHQIYVRPGTAIEGLFLGYGMRTKALRAALGLFMHALHGSLQEVPKDERLKAAHDLSYMPIGLASMHLFNISDRTFNIPPFSAQKDERGTYRAVFKKPKGGRTWHDPIFTNLPTERHKCPAHARLRVPETGNRVDSALQNMLHAGINAAVEYDYYRL